MGHKKWWFTISAIIIAAGLISLFAKGGGNPVKGLNYGLEFKEGTRISIAFEKQPALAEVRQTVANAGYADAQLQETPSVAGSNQKGFQIQTVTLSTTEQAKLKQALNDAFTIAKSNGAEIFNLQTVGATFGRQVVSSSLKGRECTTATIAAVLTILGYSLYDTVIVFDRIRENQPKLSRMPYGDMVNVSIWETLTRSINTTMIVLF